MKTITKTLVCLTACLLLMTVLFACGAGESQSQPDVNLADVLSSIESEIALDATMQGFTADTLSALYGISSADMLQFAGAYTGVGILADEIIMIQAKDAAAADSLEQAVKARYDKKLAEMKDYLPAEYDKILQSSVLRKGNYIALFVSSEQARMTEVYDAAF